MNTLTSSSAARPRFPLGRVVATPGALRLLAQHACAPTDLLARHAGGDWGEVGETDAAANEVVLVGGAPLLSAYRLPGGERVWVVTEWDRSVTTLLLPTEY